MIEQPTIEDAIRLGLAVIPCRDEKPLVPWRQFQTRGAEPEQVREWAKTYASTLTAWQMILGPPSGVFVLEADLPAGPDTARAIGINPHVRSRSGGSHTYYRYPATGARSRSKEALTAAGFRDLELKGYPSLIHWTGTRDGKPYTWLRPFGEWDDPETLPPPIRAMLTPDATPAAAPVEINADTRADWNWLLAQSFTKARSVGRNEAGLWLAAQLRDNGYSQMEATRILQDAYQPAMPLDNFKGKKEPYTRAEALATVRSAYHRPARAPIERGYGKEKRPAVTPAAKTNKSLNHSTPTTLSRPAAVSEPATPPPPPLPPPPPPPAREGKKGPFELTEAGNAERLIGRHGADLRYCYEWEKWLVWDGRRWQPDNSGEIVRRAKETIRSIKIEAAKIDNNADLQKAMEDHARKSAKKSSFQGMCWIAAAEDGTAVQPSQLDADTDLLNFRNCTLDLRTFETHPHRREDLISKMIPYDYNGAAECPTWLAFLNRIMADNEDMVKFLQRAIGYGLTGSVAEKALFVLHGSGDNGKTTLLETIKRAMGDYAGQVLIDSLMATKKYGDAGGAASPDIADLRGLRFVTSSEVEEGQRLAESKVKYLTGMGRLKARYLHQDFFEFDPQFKIFLDCNHRPQVRETTAIWNRLKLIPFAVSIPKAEQDKDLGAKLAAELPGIMAWAVQGCREWREIGLGVPKEVLDATNSYKAEMDVIAQFLDEYTQRATPHHTVIAMHLYKAYAAWCDDTGEYCIKQRDFGQKIAERGIEKIKTRRGIEYTGLKLIRIPEGAQNHGEQTGNLYVSDITNCEPCEPCEPFSRVLHENTPPWEKPPKVVHDGSHGSHSVSNLTENSSPEKQTKDEETEVELV